MMKEDDIVKECDLGVETESLTALIHAIDKLESDLSKTRRKISIFRTREENNSLEYIIHLRSLQKTERDLAELLVRAVKVLKNYRPKTAREFSDQANAIAAFLLKNVK